MGSIKEAIARRQVEAERAEAGEIAQACAEADAGHLGSRFIATKTPIGQVRTELARLTGIRRVVAAAAKSDRAIDPAFANEWYAEGLSVPEAKERLAGLQRSGPLVPREPAATAVADSGGDDWDELAAETYGARRKARESESNASGKSGANADWGDLPAQIYDARRQSRAAEA